MKEKALALSEWYAELADNDNGFTYISSYSPQGIISNISTELKSNLMIDHPDIESDLSKYKVNPPKPALLRIDLSVLVGSDIDCEFNDFDDTDDNEWFIDTLKATENDYYLSRHTGWNYCRVRENHWHYWGGNWYCPLPKGLNIELRTRNGSIKNVKDYISLGGWRHRKWVQYDDDIIGFRVLGVAEGWEY